MSDRASRTAWGPTVQVALEQLLPADRRIIHDPIAMRLLPAPIRGLVTLCRIEALRRWVMKLLERKAPGIRGGILCRKRSIDDKLILEAGKNIRAVIILGAGFDTRPYRLPELESSTIYEVDLPEVIEAKQKRFGKLLGSLPKNICFVPIDFNEQALGEALSRAGYTTDQPGFFIWEGVTQYLTEIAVHKVFEYLRQIPTGSKLGFTYIRQDFIEGRNLYNQIMLYNQTRIKQQFWQFGIDPASVPSFLKGYGWEMLEDLGSPDYQRQYLEPLNRLIPIMEVERLVFAEKI